LRTEKNGKLVKCELEVQTAGANRRYNVNLLKNANFWSKGRQS